jgi:hypothetical protein
MSYAELHNSPQYHQARKYWAILASSLLIYVVLALQVRAIEAPFNGFLDLSPTLSQTIRVLFIVLGVVVVPLTVWIIRQPPPADTGSSIVERTLIAMAFSNLPTLLGLLLYLLIARIPEFTGGLLLSALLYAYYFPRVGGPTDIESGQNQQQE